MTDAGSFHIRELTAVDISLVHDLLTVFGEAFDDVDT